MISHLRQRITQNGGAARDGKSFTGFHTESEDRDRTGISLQAFMLQSMVISTFSFMLFPSPFAFGKERHSKEPKKQLKIAENLWFGFLMAQALCVMTSPCHDWLKQFFLTTSGALSFRGMRLRNMAETSHAHEIVDDLGSLKGELAPARECPCC